jgi:hypothetical protein
VDGRVVSNDEAKSPVKNLVHIYIYVYTVYDISKLRVNWQK